LLKSTVELSVESWRNTCIKETKPFDGVMVVLGGCIDPKYRIFSVWN